MNERKSVGEVVSAEYTSFCAESFELHQAPPLGGLIITDKVVGLLYSVHTERLGESRRKGDGTEIEGAVYNKHPELKFILRTQFTCLCIGYYDAAANVRHFYPDLPPRVHYPAYLLETDDLLKFTASPNYLRPAINANESCVDQALVNLLSNVYRLRKESDGWNYLLDASEFLGRLLKGQYSRLLTILETLEEIVNQQQAAPAKDRATQAIIETADELWGAG